MCCHVQLQPSDDIERHSRYGKTSFKLIRSDMFSTPSTILGFGGKVSVGLKEIRCTDGER